MRRVGAASAVLALLAISVAPAGLAARGGDAVPQTTEIRSLPPAPRSWGPLGPPSSVSIMVDGRHRCGGVVIGRSSLLTAASCVAGLTPEVMTVRTAIDSTAPDLVKVEAWAAYGPVDGRPVDLARVTLRGYGGVSAMVSDWALGWEWWAYGSGWPVGVRADRRTRRQAPVWVGSRADCRGAMPPLGPDELCVAWAGAAPGTPIYEPNGPLGARVTGVTGRSGGPGSVVATSIWAHAGLLY